jgi:adenosylmethionine-8-amino-7-oxononanoate aminotransferase
MNHLAQLDHKYLWHPFTQMRDWLKQEPILITQGKGPWLKDVHGRKYLDANSSIWVNLHGHSHPKINAAIERQLKKIAHSSALGFANEPASLLGEKLVKLAQTGDRAGANGSHGKPSRFPAQTKNPQLAKVFFSDNGSTTMEAALKIAYQFAIRTGMSKHPKFLSLEGAYHGDTVGAVSMGHVDLFHESYRGLLFASDKVMAPYCYRCPFNRAKPEREDARKYRKCQWECVGKVERAFARQKKSGNPYAGFIFEPLMQGAAGMIPQPSGWLRQVADIARSHGALLIADEVMTGFGRTGVTCHVTDQTEDELVKKVGHAVPVFATARVGVVPDFLCVAKGLTGGYVPMAATLTTEKVFSAFLGRYDEFKTFFHGHSFTGNQVAAAASLASLEILGSQECIQTRTRLQNAFQKSLPTLWQFPQVGDIRQVGLVMGIDLVKNWRTREPFPLKGQVGFRICDAMARRGVLTRPVGNVIVFIPPYCTTPAQAAKTVAALGDSIRELFGGKH